MSLGHIVWFEKPELAMPEGSKPEQDRIVAKNMQKLRSNFHEKLAVMTSAGMFEGIVIHSKMETGGTMCIDGPDDKIAALTQFVQSQKIGTVTPNLETQTIY